MKRIFTFVYALFILTFAATSTLLAGNVITYTASEKLSETTEERTEGLHTNAFNVAITSHEFSNGTGTITFAGEVTTIGNRAFYICELTSIEIPNSVTSIGDYAFAYSGLTSITIPESVTAIGEGAFETCSKMTSITIPNSVKTIGNSALQGCSGLTSIEIPSSITTISNGIFRSCTGLKSVTIPNTITTIGENAFWNCNSLTSIKIPNSVKTIGEYAFRSCTSLTSINIPDAVTTIEEGTFYICSSLPSITIPNTVKTIEKYAFYNCSKLASITIPSSVTSIGDGIFRFCSGLTSIEISNSVETIGSEAFLNCTSLTSITIPSSVTTIGGSALKGCTGLTSITCEAVTPPSCGEYCFTSVDKSIPVYVPFGSVDAYKAANGWKDFTNIKADSKDTSLDNITLSINKDTLYQNKEFKYNGTVTANYSDKTTKDVTANATFTGYNMTALGDQTVTVSYTEGEITKTAQYTLTVKEKPVPSGYATIYTSNVELPAGLRAYAVKVIVAENVTVDGLKGGTGSSPGIVKVGIPAATKTLHFHAVGWRGVTVTLDVNGEALDITSDEGIANNPPFTLQGDAYDYYYAIDPKGADTITFEATAGNRFVLFGVNAVEQGAAAAPVITPSVVAETYWDPVKVGLSCATEGATIYYSIDGSAPSIKYTDSITISATTTVKAIAKKQGLDDSNVVSKTFTFGEIYANLAELVNAGEPTQEGRTVKVTLTNEEILSLVSNNGIMLQATKEKQIEVYCYNRPTDWEVGGKVSGTLICPWHKYNDTWELCPTSWDDLTYTPAVTKSVITYTATSKLPEVTNNSSAGLHTNAFNVAIASHTFSNGTGTITFAGEVTTIGEYAFYDCSALTSVAIPNSVETIGNMAFYRCSNLTSINVHTANTHYCSIDGVLFNYAKDMLIQYPIGNTQTEYTIPNSVTSIEGYAFASCKKITSITIPSSVKTIGEYAFRSCTSLTSITIPESVTAIGYGAFDGCTGLTSLNIPNSVTSIGKDAFCGCTGLTSITCEAVTPPSCGWSCFDGVDKSIPVYVPEGSVSAYQTTYGWEEFTNIQVNPKDIPSITERDTVDIISNTMTYNDNFITSLKAAHYYAGEDAEGYTTFLVTSKNATSIEGTFDIYVDFSYATPTTGNQISFKEGQFTVASDDKGLHLTGWVIGDDEKYYRLNWAQPVPKVTLESITLSINKDTLYQNKEFKYNGTVTANYSDKTTKDVTANATFTGYNMTALGDQTVTVSYTEGEITKTAQYTLTVKEKIIPSGYATVYTSNVELPAIGFRVSAAKVVVAEGVTVDGLTGGTGSSAGIVKVGIPAATKTLHFHVVGWNNAEVKLAVNNDTISILSDAGIAGNSPFTLVGDAYDYYYAIDPKGADTVTFEAVQGYRFVLFGVNAVEQGAAVAPMITPSVVAETYWDPVKVGLSCATEGATIYYSIDGSAPSIKYTDSITITATTTLKAVAKKQGLDDSNVVSKTFTFGEIYANLAELVNAGEPTQEGRTVKVTLTNEEILSLVFNNGIMLQATKEKQIEVYCHNRPTDWEVGGKVSGILICPWHKYKDTWELCPASWDNLSYTPAVTKSVITYTATSKLPEVTDGLSEGLHTNAFNVAITSHTFSNGTGTITFAGNVTTIGDWAFHGCSDLTSITIPNSVTSIGRDAFNYCTGLTSITSLATTPPSCGTGCFNSVDKSIPVYVPKESISAYKAANGWKDFTNIQPIGGEEPQNNVITYTATSKLPEVTNELSDGLHTNAFNVAITSHEFSNGTGTITFAGEVTTIGNDAFYGCTGLTSVTIGNSVTTIGEYAFYSCGGLTSITIPNSVTTIGDLVFYNCIGLKSITIPNSVTTIGNWTFSYCTGLTSLNIPNSVTSIGRDAFSYCTGLTSITSLATTPPSCGQNCFYDVDKSIPVSVPEGSISAYKAANEWKEFTNYVGDNSVYITDAKLSLGKEYIASSGVLYYCIEATDYVVFLWAKATNPYGNFKDVFDFANSAIRIYRSGVQQKELGFNKADEFEVHQDGNTMYLTANVTDTEGTQYIISASGYSGTLAYDATSPFTASFDYEDISDVSMKDGTCSIIVQSEKQYLELEVYTNPSNSKLPAGTYTISDSKTPGTVLKSVGFDSRNFSRSYAATISADGQYIETPWYLVEGTMKIDYTANDQIMITVNAYNSSHQSVNIAVNVFNTCQINTSAKHGYVEGAGYYEKGSVALLIAYPDKGYKFVRWSDETIYNPYYFVVDGNKNIEAIFERVTDDLQDIYQPSPVHKIMKDGTIYIQINGNLYDVFGRQIL